MTLTSPLLSAEQRCGREIATHTTHDYTCIKHMLLQRQLHTRTLRVTDSGPGLAPLTKALATHTHTLPRGPWRPRGPTSGLTVQNEPAYISSPLRPCPPTQSPKPLTGQRMGGVATTWSIGPVAHLGRANATRGTVRTSGPQSGWSRVSTAGEGNSGTGMLTGRFPKLCQLVQGQASACRPTSRLKERGEFKFKVGIIQIPG